jgi:hypothetical protein
MTPSPADETIVAREVRTRCDDIASHLKAERPSYTYLEWLEIRRLSGEMVDKLKGTES